MQNTKSKSAAATQADLDAALMSKLAYGNWDQVENLAAGKSIREALGPQAGQRPGESTLSDARARYMDEHYEVVQVENFGDDIHAIAFRYRKTGHVTVAIPGTNLRQSGDRSRAAGIIAGAELDATSKVKEFARKMYEKYGPVTVTGHSAGGYMAGKIAEELGPNVVKEAIMIQAPRQQAVRVTNEDSVAWREVVPEETEVTHLTDLPNVRAIQAEGDFIGNYSTDESRAEVWDVGDAGANDGFLRDHNLDNLINSKIDALASQSHGYSAEYKHWNSLRSVPKSDHPDAPGYDPDSVGYEFGRWSTDGGAPTDTPQGPAAGTKRTKDAQEAPRGNQSTYSAGGDGQRAGGGGSSGGSKGAQILDGGGAIRSMSHTLEMRYDPDAPPIKPHTMEMRYDPDAPPIKPQILEPWADQALPGRDPRRGSRAVAGGAAETGDPARAAFAAATVAHDPAAAAARLAELQRRLGRPPQSKRTAGSPFTPGTLVQDTDGYGFTKAKAKDDSAAGLGRAASSGTNTGAGAATVAPKRPIDQAYRADGAGKPRFDPQSFLKLPLDGLDQDDIRRVMNEPDYWRTSRPHAKDLYKRVSAWYGRAYPG